MTSDITNKQARQTSPSFTMHSPSVKNETTSILFTRENGEMATSAVGDACEARIVSEERELDPDYDLEKGVEKETNIWSFYCVLLGVLLGFFFGPLAYLLLLRKTRMYEIEKHRLCFVWGVVLGLCLSITVVFIVWNRIIRNRG